MMKQLVTALALTILISGCAGESVKPATAESAKASIAAAEEARKKAASVKGEWRDTAKMIKAAEEAASKGDFETAVKQAELAHEQGVLGYEQAHSQKELRIPSYIKY